MSPVSDMHILIDSCNFLMAIKKSQPKKRLNLQPLTVKKNNKKSLNPLQNGLTSQKLKSPLQCHPIINEYPIIAPAITTLKFLFYFIAIFAPLLERS